MRPNVVKLAVLLVTAAALCVGPPAAAAGPLQTAPGRIVDGAGRDVPTAGVEVALPDGSKLLFAATGNLATLPVAERSTFAVVKVRPDGMPDRTFGDGGVRRVRVDGLQVYDLREVVRQADGKLLLVFGTQDASLLPAMLASSRVLVARLEADLSRDGSYGAGGVATTGVFDPNGAVVQPDGALVVIGSTGGIPLVNGIPGPPALRWSLTRLTPAGTIDSSFGRDGIATIPTEASTYGAAVAAGPGSTIVALSQPGAPVPAPARCSRASPPPVRRTRRSRAVRPCRSRAATACTWSSGETVRCSCRDHRADRRAATRSSSATPRREPSTWRTARVASHDSARTSPRCRCCRPREARRSSRGSSRPRPRTGPSPRRGISRSGACPPAGRSCCAAASCSRSAAASPATAPLRGACCRTASARHRSCGAPTGRSSCPAAWGSAGPTSMATTTASSGSRSPR